MSGVAGLSVDSGNERELLAETSGEVGPAVTVVLDLASACYKELETQVAGGRATKLYLVHLGEFVFGEPWRRGTIHVGDCAPHLVNSVVYAAFAYVLDGKVDLARNAVLPDHHSDLAGWLGEQPEGSSEPCWCQDGWQRRSGERRNNKQSFVICERGSGQKGVGTARSLQVCLLVGSSDGLTVSFLEVAEVFSGLPTDLMNFW